jgi:hypothetical protein
MSNVTAFEFMAKKFNSQNEKSPSTRDSISLTTLPYLIYGTVAHVLFILLYFTIFVLIEIILAQHLYDDHISTLLELSAYLMELYLDQVTGPLLACIKRQPS